MRLEPLYTTIDGRGQLLSIEGRAAGKYWQAIGKLLLVEAGWLGRVTQGATDSLNSALNYGYGILYSQVERALMLAGLDPYAGSSTPTAPANPAWSLTWSKSSARRWSTAPSWPSSTGVRP
ncbi:MAG: CRISPR-associated endonuclease Cas1 [Caldilineaceae bacterium]